MKVQGSVALVTGGASGLGEGAVRMVVENGGQAGILDLPDSKGADLAEDLGDAAVFVPADVTQPDQVEKAVKETTERFGRLDVCVNSAGIGPSQRVVGKNRELFPLEMFTKVVDLNLNGLFDVLRWSALMMSHNEPSDEGERGLFVNVASIAGAEGQTGQAAYSASKGGVMAMTLPLARDLALWGIRVMTICPGIMDTPLLAGAPDHVREAMIKIHTFPKRLGTAEDFASLVRQFMENTMLNGDIVRLDAGTRLS